MPIRGFVTDVRRNATTVYVYNVYMATNPVTYRISPEVDAKLKALAEKHGGVDKALRVLLEDHAVTNSKIQVFKGPLLKPKDRK